MRRATDPQKAVGEVDVRPAQGECLTPAPARGGEQAHQWRIRDWAWRCSALLSSAYLPFDPGCRVAGEQFVPHRRRKFAMASMGKSETKVSELCKEFGISRQTFYGASQ